MKGSFNRSTLSKHNNEYRRKNKKVRQSKLKSLEIITKFIFYKIYDTRSGLR